MSQSAASGSVSLQDERGRGIAAACEGGALAISSLPVAPLTLLLTLQPNGGERETKASRLLNGFFWPFYTGRLPKEMRAKKLDWRQEKNCFKASFQNSFFYVTFVGGAESPNGLLMNTFCFIFSDKTWHWIRSGYRQRRCADSFQMFTGRNLFQHWATWRFIVCSFN